MQKKITLQKLEGTVNEKEIFKTELLSKLEKSEREYEEGKIHDAKAVFKELRAKYGY